MTATAAIAPASEQQQQQQEQEQPAASPAVSPEGEEETTTTNDASSTQFLTSKEEDDDDDIQPLWTQAACSSDDNDSENDDEDNDDNKDGCKEEKDDLSQNQEEDQEQQADNNHQNNNNKKITPPSSTTSPSLVPSTSRRLGEKMSSQQFQLQVVEEGRALKCTHEPGIICHATCTFPVTGKHCLGCTLAPPPEFDPTRGEGYVYQHDFVAAAAADLTSNCTTNDSSDEDGHNRSKIYVMEGLDDNLLMNDASGRSFRSFRSGRTITEYQRLARNLLLLFLSVGTFILLMVLIVPSYAQNKSEQENEVVEDENPDGP